jgi:hypothetical protein
MPDYPGPFDNPYDQGHTGGSGLGTGGGPAPPTPDPFADWYKNTIQANPNKYDTGISQDQWKAWFPLWTGSGFKSSKVDVNGNPIAGTFDKPDDCPPGMQAYGQNTCAPVGYHSQGGPGGPGGGGGGVGGGGFQGGNYGFGINYPDLPIFKAPTNVTEQNDPGYSFRLKQGEDALAASAAAKGVLNTGGTLADTLKYGQEFASNEYANVFQRAKDAYAPLLAEWQMKAGGAQASALAAFQQAWERYQFNINDEFRREQMLLNAGGPTA